MYKKVTLNQGAAYLNYLMQSARWKQGTSKMKLTLDEPNMNFTRIFDIAHKHLALQPLTEFWKGEDKYNFTTTSNNAIFANYLYD